MHVPRVLSQRHTYHIVKDIQELLKPLLFPEGAACFIVNCDNLQCLQRQMLNNREV